MGSTQGIWGRSNMQQRALEKLIFGDYILMTVLGQEKRLFPNRATSHLLRRGHMISKNRKVFPAKVSDGAMQNLWHWGVNTLFPTRKLTARGYLLHIFVQFFLPWKKSKLFLSGLPLSVCYLLSDIWFTHAVKAGLKMRFINERSDWKIFQIALLWHRWVVPLQKDCCENKRKKKVPAWASAQEITSSCNFPFPLIFLSLLFDPYEPFSRKQGKVQDVESRSLHCQGRVAAGMRVIRNEEGSFAGTTNRPRSHVKSVAFVFLVSQLVEISDDCDRGIPYRIKMWKHIQHSSRTALGSKTLDQAFKGMRSRWMLTI